MDSIRGFSKRVGVLAAVASFGCASRPPQPDEFASAARGAIEEQEVRLLALVRALASAQRNVANANWEPILGQVRRTEERMVRGIQEDGARRSRIAEELVRGIDDAGTMRRLLDALKSSEDVDASPDPRDVEESFRQKLPPLGYVGSR